MHPFVRLQFWHTAERRHLKSYGAAAFLFGHDLGEGDAAVALAFAVARDAVADLIAFSELFDVETGCDEFRSSFR
jgi:hypothetical protein